MSALNIINRLINAGMTVNGALGMWGNIMAESGGKSNIVQRGMTQYDDETYTRYVDEGRLEFCHDCAGYGLIQLTFWSRKKGLLDRAKARGVSVGDENLQVDYLIEEIKTYSKTWKAVTNPATSIYDATAIICTDFERPAVNNIDKRYQYAVDAYNTYKDQLDGHVDAEPTPEPELIPTDPVTLSIIKRGDRGISVAMMQIALKCHGYWTYPLEKWADGDFGSGTENKLKLFQQKNGITADGVCGNQTWYCLLKK